MGEGHLYPFRTHGAITIIAVSLHLPTEAIQTLPTQRCPARAPPRRSPGPPALPWRSPGAHTPADHTAGEEADQPAARIKHSYMWNDGLYTGDSYNDLFGGFRQKQDSNDVVNATFGLQRNSWTAELYVQNLTDERGQLWFIDVNWDERVTINQPRKIGFRWQQRL